MDRLTEKYNRSVRIRRTDPFGDESSASRATIGRFREEWNRRRRREESSGYWDSSSGKRWQRCRCSDGSPACPERNEDWCVHLRRGSLGPLLRCPSTESACTVGARGCSSRSASHFVVPEEWNAGWRHPDGRSPRSSGPMCHFAEAVWNDFV